jgi:hypothetical protein
MAQMHSISVPPDFEAKFLNALHTFNHQTVFDPVTGTLLPLTPFSGEVDVSVLGEIYDSELATGVARGTLCPITKKTFQTPPLVCLQWLRPAGRTAAMYSAEKTADVIDEAGERETTKTESVVDLDESPPAKKLKAENFLNQFAFGKPVSRKIGALAKFSFNP